MQLPDKIGDPGKRVKHASRNGYQGSVIKESPEQILLDSAHGGL
jgi:hypothetical protein